MLRKSSGEDLNLGSCSAPGLHLQQVSVRQVHPEDNFLWGRIELVVAVTNS